jgi:hypothetical protein
MTWMQQERAYAACRQKYQAKLLMLGHGGRILRRSDQH